MHVMLIIIANPSASLDHSWAAGYKFLAISGCTTDQDLIFCLRLDNIHK